MIRSRWIVHTLLLSGAAVATAHAQTKALVLFGHAGRSASLVDLTAGGDDFAPDFSLGGSVALQFGPAVAIRGSYARLTTKYRGGTLGFGNRGFVRNYIGGSIQVGWPAEGALVPYTVIGGGVVSSDPKEAGQETVRPMAGNLGLGVNYLGSPFVLFAEVSGWAYRFKAYGLDRVQVDLLIQTGVAIAFPF
jgi:hypothetical protein